MSISDPYHFLPGGRGAGVATAVIGAGMATLGGAGMAAFGGAGMATSPASPAAAFPMLWAGHCAAISGTGRARKTEPYACAHRAS